MPPKLVADHYGKSRVRLSHIRRDGDRHGFTELVCSIELTGDFEAAYSAADNSLVVPTDTMKNTVYALARRDGVESLEAYSRTLARHFVDSFPQVATAQVSAEQTPWARIIPHPHAFVSGGCERHTCSVTAAATGLEQSVGFSGLRVLKTSGSAFAGFQRDAFTTLQPTDERIFATTIQAEWPCPDPNLDWTSIRNDIRTRLLNVFANLHSESVQHTLYEMGAAALAAREEIDSIRITMPNQHHLLADLTPLGLDNPNEVFIPTDEPHGVIAATIARDDLNPPA